MAKRKKPGSGKGRPGRGSGKPRPTERVIGPAEQLEIARLKIRHTPNTTIAELLGVAESTIRYHLDNHIKPAWRAELAGSLDEELARVRAIEAIAWQKFDESTEEHTKEQIRRELVDKTGKDGTSEKMIDRVLEKWKTPGDKGWLSILQWCVELRCKIRGDFGAAAGDLHTEPGMRVAGLTPAQLDEQMLKVVAARIEERRREKAALAVQKGP